MSTFKVELGSKARDRVTSYTGIVYARHEYLYGCRRYTLQAQELKDGKPVETLTTDEDALEVLDAAEPHVINATGGPRDEPARRSDPVRRADPVR